MADRSSAAEGKCSAVLGLGLGMALPTCIVTPACGHKGLLLGMNVTGMIVTRVKGLCLPRHAQAVSRLVGDHVRPKTRCALDEGLDNMRSHLLRQIWKPLLEHPLQPLVLATSLGCPPAQHLGGCLQVMLDGECRGLLGHVEADKREDEIGEEEVLQCGLLYTHPLVAKAKEQVDVFIDILPRNMLQAPPSPIKLEISCCPLLELS